MGDSRWREYMDLWAQNADLIDATLDPSSPLLEAETHRLLLQTLVRTYPEVFHGDPRHPDWMPQLNSLYPHAATNPDTTYLYATIAGDGAYRISGFRGSVRYVDVQTGRDLASPGLATLDLDDFTIADDGAFSFMWSAERPAGYAGDWRPLPPEAGYVMIRQVAYDWLHEEDARIAIERLDVPATRPRMSAEEIHQNVLRVLQSSRLATRRFPGMLVDKRERGVVNRLELNAYADTGGVVGQKYYEGLFSLAEDEALLVEAPIPAECGYWSVHLFDDLFVTLDWVNRQSHLNGHTAFVAADGRAQVVLAARDPGVRNWLDTSGYARGGLTWRWLRTPDATPPELRVVPLTEVRAHLHGGTPDIAPVERERQASERRVGAQLRRRW